MRKYKEVEIERLVPYANNARTHSQEQIKKLQASLREFGFINPVLIDGEYGIIAGHGRVEAAKAEGMDKVPCIFIDDLTEAQKKAYILADNRLAEDAGWDEELLQIELEGLKDFDFDVDLTGFDINEGGHFWDEEGESNEEYEEFTEKFKPKLTTDDCYTPANIYEAVKNWAVKEYDLQKVRIIRPFYPGGDYQQEDYSGDCVVIDNPPFSILSEITKWYEENNIRFFLFSQSLTLFSTNKGKLNYITSGATITYENGAVVRTGFITNMGNYKIVADAELSKLIREENDKNMAETTARIPKYEYPECVATAMKYAYIADHGVSLKIKAEECHFIRALDSQKEEGKTIYGAGFLLSEQAAAEQAAAEQAAKDADEVKKWELSEREREIIEGLGKKGIIGDD